MTATQTQAKTKTTAQTAAQTQQNAVEKAAPNTVFVRAARKYGIDDPDNFAKTLKLTCWKPGNDGREPNNAELAALLMVADKCNLNPVLGEIYAFPNKNGGIVPIVGINGWRQIAASHPQFAGVRFEYASNLTEVQGVTGPEYVKCIVKRRHADGTAFESEGYAFFAEKFRATDPWKRQPRQMLANKAQIQALKNAFPSLSSIYDEEEGREMSGANGYPASAAMADQAATVAMKWTRPDLKKKIEMLCAHGKATNDFSKVTRWIMKYTQGADQQFALSYSAKLLAGLKPEDVVDVEPNEAPEAEPVQVKEPEQATAQAQDPDFDEAGMI